MKLLKMSVLLAMSVFVVACSQPEPEPVVVIEAEPVYDKYGNPV